MKKIVGLLKNRNFILLMSVCLGLITGDGAYFLKDTVLFWLALIMSLSTTAISSAALRSIKSMLVPAIAGVFLSYGFCGGLLLALNSLVIKNVDFWTGFVLISAVPPAVAVIPFSVFLKADTEFVLFGAIGAYVCALFITPLTLVTFLDSSLLSPGKIFSILLELIIGPLILSRILIWTGLAKKIEPVKGTIINWGFFLVTYTITGLNRDFILQKPLELISPLTLCIMSTFFFGWIIQFFGKLSKLNDRILKGMVLLGTYKNYGLAGGLSLVFFSPETAVPAALASTISILYVIYLQLKIKKSPG